MTTKIKRTFLPVLLALTILTGVPSLRSQVAAQSSGTSQLEQAKALYRSCDVFAAVPWRNGTKLSAGGWANCDGSSFGATFYWSLVYAQPGGGADPRVARWSYWDYNTNWDANNSADIYYCGGSVGYYSAVTIESDDGTVLLSDYSSVTYIPYCYYD